MSLSNADSIADSIAATTAAPSAILDVLIIGAGLSGIGAARHLQRYCPLKRYAILEARQALGGTWDLFRYPGVRSDSDMHTLGYSFKPWTGQKAIAEGGSVLNYIRSAARETGVDQHIRYGQTVKAADWSSTEACWTITVAHTETGALSTIQTRFLYFCSGYYSYAEGHQPTFPGQADFQGRFVHPQFWPQDLSYADKRVIIIGSGATAVTLVPEMAKSAAHVTMLQRSPTYVVSLPSEDALARKLARYLPLPLAAGITRWKNVLFGMLVFQLARRRPAMLKRHIVSMAARQLGPQVDVATHFTPHYQPWDQRLCAVPDGDLFRQLRAGRASVVTAAISCFTEHGIRLSDGQELKADIIVSATGLKLNVLGDVTIRVDGKAYLPDQALAYKGMLLSDLPNVAMAYGYTNASWTLKADLTARYVCRLLNYMDSRAYTTVSPKGDPAIPRRAYVSFNSGYVLRASAMLPKQGDRAPWQIVQNYLLDLLNLRFSRIADGVLQFSGTASATKGS